MRRLGAVILLVMVALAVPFLLWRDAGIFSISAIEAWMRAHPAWTGPAAAGLLALDLAMPVPSTGVLTLLGAAMGWAAGAAWGAAGMISSAAIGYGLARLAGGSMAGRLMKRGELDRFRAFFERYGAFAVILSRSLPLVGETVSILSGLAAMRPVIFFAAAILGSAPVAIFYAALGAYARQTVGTEWGLAASLILPLLVWVAVRGRFGLYEKDASP